jgi:hypothetical protein
MKPHPIDPFSLVAGIAFVALGIAGFAGSVELGDIDRGALMPIALLAIAVAIVSSLRTPASSRHDEPTAENAAIHETNETAEIDRAASSD